jgi:hypothetical protein
VQFLDTGHFAIETHVVEIAAAMKNFFAANGVRPAESRTNGLTINTFCSFPDRR